MAPDIENRVSVSSPPKREISPPLRRMLLWTLVGALCLAIIHISALANGYYQIYYGRFGWGLTEVAFLLHYLLFGTAATFCLGAALSLGIGHGLATVFDRL